MSIEARLTFKMVSSKMKTIKSEKNEIEKNRTE